MTNFPNNSSRIFEKSKKDKEVPAFKEGSKKEKMKDKKQKGIK